MVVQQVERQTTTAWDLDASHSLVEFAVKHMMFTTVKGRFAAFSGEIIADEIDPTKSSVNVTIDVTSITTADPKRDGHLLSPDFFDSETYPTISFVSDRVERAGGDRLKVHGDLTIRGITKPVVLDSTFNGQGGSPFGTTVSAYSAETTISRKEFGLNWNVALETGGVIVGDNVKISIEAEAVKK